MTIGNYQTTPPPMSQTDRNETTTLTLIGQHFHGPANQSEDT